MRFAGHCQLAKHERASDLLLWTVTVTPGLVGRQQHMQIIYAQILDIPTG